MGSGRRNQILKEAPAKGSKLIEFNSLQRLFIATYPDPRPPQPDLSVSRDKTYNQPNSNPAVNPFLLCL